MAHKDIDVPSSVSRETCGLLYRQVLASLKEGDTLELCEQDFTCGGGTTGDPVQNLVFPAPNIRILGQGAGRTFLRCSWHDDPAPGCAFELEDYAVYEKLTIDNNCLANQQSEAIGFMAGTGSNNCQAFIRDCDVLAPDWGLSSWGARNGCSVTMERSCLSASRVLVGACRSSGADAQRFKLIDCFLSGDSTQSTYQGRVGELLTAFVCRGGHIETLRCFVELKADPLIEVARGAWIPLLENPPGGPASAWNGASPWSSIDLIDTHFRIIGGKQQWDIDDSINGIKKYGGSGSDVDGGWKVNRPLPVIAQVQMSVSMAG